MRQLGRKLDDDLSSNYDHVVPGHVTLSPRRPSIFVVCVCVCVQVNFQFVIFRIYTRCVAVKPSIPQPWEVIISLFFHEINNPSSLYFRDFCYILSGFFEPDGVLVMGKIRCFIKFFCVLVNSVNFNPLVVELNNETGIL